MSKRRPTKPKRKPRPRKKAPFLLTPLTFTGEALLRADLPALYLEFMCDSCKPIRWIYHYERMNLLLQCGPTTFLYYEEDGSIDHVVLDEEGLATLPIFGEE